MSLPAILNVKVSSLGTLSQRNRVEAAFAQYLCLKDIPSPPGVILGFPVMGKTSKTPVNIITGYINCSYSFEIKEMALNFILETSLKKFKKTLNMETALVLVPKDHSLYISNKYTSIVKIIPENVANIKTTPKGVVAITKLNRWELESYLDSLIKMY